MDMSNPFSLRSGSVDPLALLPAGSRKPAPARSPAHFERHLDSPRSDAARRPERERSRDEDDRVDTRSHSKRADAARDKKDSTNPAAEQSGEAVDLTLDPSLLAAARPGAEDETNTAPGEDGASVPLTLDENPEQAGTSAALLPETEAAQSEADAAAPEEIAAATQTHIAAHASETARADAKPGEGRQAAQSMNAPSPHETGEKTKAGQTAQTASKATASPDTNADVPADATQAVKRAMQQQQAEAQVPLAAPVEKSVEGKTSLSLGQEAAAKMARSKAENKSDAKPDNKISPADKLADARVFAPQAATNAARASSAAAASAMSSSADGSVDGQTSTLPQPVSQQSNNNAPTIRFGTLPGHATPTQVPAGAIALQMARNLQKGMSRFDIRLDPAELGRIDVRMEVQKDGRVAAHMIVERPETLDLLQRDASALTRALNDAGLQTSSDSLNFSLRDQNAGNGSPFASGTTPDTAIQPQDASEESMTPIYNVNLSATGGVDIRV